MDPVFKKKNLNRLNVFEYRVKTGRVFCVSEDLLVIRIKSAFCGWSPLACTSVRINCFHTFIVRERIAANS